MRNWDAEREILLNRRKVAIDKTMRLSLARRVSRGTKRVAAPQALANYAAAKADYDQIAAEIETLEDERSAMSSAISLPAT